MPHKHGLYIPSDHENNHCHPRLKKAAIGIDDINLPYFLWALAIFLLYKELIRALEILTDNPTKLMSNVVIDYQILGYGLFVVIIITISKILTRNDNIYESIFWGSCVGMFFNVFIIYMGWTIACALATPAYY